MLSEIYLGGFDNMNPKQNENKILDDMVEELGELRRLGKLNLFEDAMDNAMEKFKNALLEKTAEVINTVDDEENSAKKNIKTAEEKLE